MLLDGMVGEVNRALLFIHGNQASTASKCLTHVVDQPCGNEIGLARLDTDCFT